MADPRLMGQEVTVRLTQAGSLVTEVTAIANFNEEVNIEIKESSFLGEGENRYDEVFNGFGGDLEFQPENAGWVDVQEAIIARARRETPEVQFSIIRVDSFSNGDTLTYTYMDVKFGPQPTSLSGRTEYAKTKFSFKCSKRAVKKNGLI